MLLYEATADWYSSMLTDIPIHTPTLSASNNASPQEFQFLNVFDKASQVKVIPILRSGLLLLETSEAVLPLSSIHHIGFARDESTLEPTMYLNKVTAIENDNW